MTDRPWPIDRDWPTVALAFGSASDLVNEIGRLWLQLDAEKSRLRTAHFAESSGGYEKLIRDGDIAYELVCARRKLDRDVLTFLRPHMDASLLERCTKFLRLTDLHGFAAVGSDPKERPIWRLYWTEIEAVTYTDELIQLLKVASDRERIRAAKTPPHNDKVDRRQLGFTAKQLRDEAIEAGANCSETKFRQIRCIAGIKPHPKKQHFSYGAMGVRKLARAAKNGGVLNGKAKKFRDGGVISNAWLTLISDESAEN